MGPATTRRARPRSARVDDARLDALRRPRRSSSQANGDARRAEVSIGLVELAGEHPPRRMREPPTMRSRAREAKPGVIATSASPAHRPIGPIGKSVVRGPPSTTASHSVPRRRPDRPELRRGPELASACTTASRRFSHRRGRRHRDLNVSSRRSSSAFSGGVTSARDPTRAATYEAMPSTTRTRLSRASVLLRELLHREAVPHRAVLARGAPHQPADAAVRLRALRLGDDVLRPVVRVRHGKAWSHVRTMVARLRLRELRDRGLVADADDLGVLAGCSQPM